MLTVTINGAQRNVASGTLSMPLVGAWTADLVIDVDEKPSGDVVATLSEVDMPAHIQRAEMVGLMARVRLVGGNGGLATIAKPKYYRNTVVKNVLADLLRDAGESVSGAMTSTALNVPLSYWVTMGMPTGSILQAMADVMGWTWRVWFNGTIWMGTETWPACPADVRIIDKDPANASALIGTDAQGVWPGTSIDGRRIDLVVHEIGGAAPRSRVWFAEGHE